MSNAKAILAERLAKGDITEAEYDRMITKLGSGPSAGEEPQKSAEDKSRQIGERLGTTLLLFFPMILIFAYRWISGDEKTDLTEVFGNWIAYVFGGLGMIAMLKLFFYDFRS